MHTILSIQSSVAYGHVGNSAAVFPLQRLGIEVWPVNTVQFSNHLGYGDWRGDVFTPQAVGEVIAGIADRGVLSRCDAVLSGYMGDVSLGAVILDAVARVRAANPNALYCCDPVIGDIDSGAYVKPKIAEFFAETVVPLADILTPNHFELQILTGRTVTTLAEALDAAEALRARGPRTVLVTSLRRTDVPAGIIEMLAVDDDGAFAVSTPDLPIVVNGCGDAVAAMFLAHRLRTGSTGAALGPAAASVFAMVETTLRLGARELQIVAAQDEIAAPRRTFHVERLR